MEQENSFPLRDFKYHIDPGATSTTPQTVEGNNSDRKRYSDDYYLIHSKHNIVEDLNNKSNHYNRNSDNNYSSKNLPYSQTNYNRSSYTETNINAEKGKEEEEGEVDDNISTIVNHLYSTVLQKTVKEAQLKILRIKKKNLLQSVSYH